MKFVDYKFDAKIESQILAKGYEVPTPIQQKAIPEILAGKDVMGLAQTGTGKTAAFVLPMLQKFLHGHKGHLRGLIIAPTRELAEQINKYITDLGKRTGLRSVTLYGGVSKGMQIKELKRGVDIAVVCPGRLLDHIGDPGIDLSKIEVLVLDEADQMFDMGFLPSIKEILKHVPVKRQTLMFSATMPHDIRTLAHAILKNPATIEVGHTQPLGTITHTAFPVSQHLKTDLLLELLNRTATQSVLIFTRTKHRAKSLSDKLQKKGFRAESLQGNLSQNRRQEVLDGFRGGKTDILVATDIAARGIDISKVSHVINYDFPDTPESYTHRIGRTGRASRSGDAYSFITGEDSFTMRLVEKKMGEPIKTRMLENFDYKTASNPMESDSGGGRRFSSSFRGRESFRSGSGAGGSSGGHSHSASKDHSHPQDKKPDGSSSETPAKHAYAFAHNWRTRSKRRR